MSHISTVRLTLDDMDALAAGCRQCGVELRLGQKTYRTYGNVERPCDAAIVLTGNRWAYEIGVVRVRQQSDGTYVDDPNGNECQLRFDDWDRGNGMMDQVGPECSALMQQYGVEKTRSIAKRNGWSFKTETQRDGSVRCYCQPKQKKWARAGAGRKW